MTRLCCCRYELAVLPDQWEGMDTATLRMMLEGLPRDTDQYEAVAAYIHARVSPDLG